MSISIYYYCYCYFFYGLLTPNRMLSKRVNSQLFFILSIFSLLVLLTLFTYFLHFSFNPLTYFTLCSFFSLHNNFKLIVSFSFQLWFVLLPHGLNPISPSGSDFTRWLLYICIYFFHLSFPLLTKCFSVSSSSNFQESFDQLNILHHAHDQSLVSLQIGCP